MDGRTGQRERLRVDANRLAGTTTLSSTPASRAEDTSSCVRSMFGDDVSAAMHLQLQLVVRASESAETALPDVIALMVPGNAAKRTAIVNAISSNEPLREQWYRTWAVLRR